MQGEAGVCAGHYNRQDCHECKATRTKGEFVGPTGAARASGLQLIACTWWQHSASPALPDDESGAWGVLAMPGGHAWL